MKTVISEMALKLINNKIANGYYGRACEQLNLLLSLEDYFKENDEMEELMRTVQDNFKKHIDSRRNGILMTRSIIMQ